jgi:large subunit ribosomal protein LP0
MPLSAERKTEYFERMKNLLDKYQKLFIVEVDNVGSQQLQNTRAGLRGTAEILMGKNTMMRKIIKEYAEENPGTPKSQLEACCRGNVGMVFTNGDLSEVRSILESNVRPAPARVGAIAPINVIVPKGPTGCDPGQTAFFQTLQIATKITRGQIEITNDVPLITAGEKVTASEAALLQKLNIEPFTYGLILKAVYDNGSLFDAKVLDITDDVLAAKFGEALKLVASLSLKIGYPTQASVPHSIANAFKAILAVTVCLDKYIFDEAAPYKELVGGKTAEAAPAEEEAPAEEAPAPAPAAAADY